MAPSRNLPVPLILYFVLYGGMTCIAGVLGAKQIALGPLAVEGGIFPFLLLIAISSAVARLYGEGCARLLVLIGFVPLVASILLAWMVIHLPTDVNMYEPAKAAFPLILGQTGRLMIAGIVAYGISVTLNVHLFLRLERHLRWQAVTAAVASVLSQVVDTLVFITVAFLGTRPLAGLLMGQAAAKVMLSVIAVPPVVALLTFIGDHWDHKAVAVMKPCRGR